MCNVHTDSAKINFINSPLAPFPPTAYFNHSNRSLSPPLNLHRRTLMRQIVLIFIVAVALAFLLSACVTSGKYDEMTAMRDQSNHNYDSLSTLTSGQIAQLHRENDSLRL